MDPRLPINHDLQKAVLIVPPVFCLVATVSLLLRGLARKVANRSLDSSDYIMIAALVSTQRRVMNTA